MKKRRAIILGSKPAAVAALLLLLKRGWEVTEVVASASEHAWLPAPSLYTVAKGKGISTVEEQDRLETTGVDLVISYMCRSLVRQDAISRGRFALNFHAGPLPEFGGFAFYNVAILENAKEYGCSCHHMDDGFDSGDLVKVRRFSINASNETAVSLERRAQLEMLLLFEEVITQYERDEFLPAIPQEMQRSRYMSAKELMALKEIPLDADSDDIERIARAFWYPPYDLAYMRLPSGKKIEVMPQIAKSDVAHMVHENDLRRFTEALSLSLGQ